MQQAGTIDVEELRTLHGFVAGWLGKTQQKDMARQRAGFVTWLTKSLAAGGKAAHILTKGEEGPQAAPTSFIREGEVVAHPVLVMEHRVAGWQKIWGKNSTPWRLPGWMAPPAQSGG